ncbi:MAG: DUF192 domain-containing protein [Arenicellales bacterium WSBS_2016_MAG_OTU3]
MRRGFVWVMILWLVCGVAFAECRETPGWASMQTANVVLTGPEGQQFELAVRLADDGVERAAGYQHTCPQAAEGTAVLFLFTQPLSSRFHMRNVYVDLDIAFINATGGLIDLQRMLAEPPGSPRKPTLYGPKQIFQYALETPAGVLRDRIKEPTGWRLQIL